MILVSSNREKIKEFRRLLAPEIKVEVRKEEYDEIRSDDAAKIAAVAAEELAARLQQPVMVEDAGIFIDALHGFPGTYSKHVYNKIGLPGLVKLLEGENNRRAYYQSAIAYCEPGKKAKTFVGRCYGSIATEKRGSNGWGHDPIFIQAGKRKKYGELKKPGDVSLHRIRSAAKLKKFLLSLRK